METLRNNAQRLCKVSFCWLLYQKNFIKILIPRILSASPSLWSLSVFKCLPRHWVMQHYSSYILFCFLPVLLFFHVFYFDIHAAFTGLWVLRHTGLCHQVRKWWWCFSVISLLLNSMVMHLYPCSSRRQIRQEVPKLICIMEESSRGLENAKELSLSESTATSILAQSGEVSNHRPRLSSLSACP